MIIFRFLNICFVVGTEKKIRHLIKNLPTGNKNCHAAGRLCHRVVNFFISYVASSSGGIKPGHGYLLYLCRKLCYSTGNQTCTVVGRPYCFFVTR